MWNLVFFARRNITDACLIYFYFYYFFPGVVVSTQWKLEVIAPFLSDQKKLDGT